MVRVGLISDTHGLVRPEAKAFLQGCELIIHAGDIVTSQVLEQLRTLAPVIAVRGNNDKGAWAAGLAETELIKVGEIFIYAIHDLSQIDIEPKAAGVQVVVSGHTHKPTIETRDEILYVNPGSAGPRRFKLPISIAELTITGIEVSARIAELHRQSAT